MKTPVKAHQFTRSLPILLCAAALAAAVTGCADPSGGDDVLKGSAEATSKATDALTIGDVQWVNGTYGGSCDGHTSGAAWSIAINILKIDEDTLTNAPLSVVKNNAGCTLTLTEIMADQIYAADPAIALDDTYAASPSEFGASPGDINFYGNARLVPADFSSNFSLHFLFSDDPNALGTNNDATSATWTGASVGTEVSAPNYVIDDNIMVKTDSGHVVTDALGSLNLTSGGISGDYYFIDLAGAITPSTSFEDVDAAYALADTVLMTDNIDASAFRLVGDDLDSHPKRSVVIHRAESHVAAYQVLQVTFDP